MQPVLGFCCNLIETRITWKCSKEPGKADIPEIHLATAVGVTQTNNPEIDGLLSGSKWTGTISYSFTDSPGDYIATNYSVTGEPTTSGFSAAPAAMQQAINYSFSL